MEARIMLRRYDLPSVNHEGWAVVVIDTNGYFSTVSDYGNYAYWWGSMGVDDLREFLVRCNADYVRCKLDPSRVLDGRRTEAGLRGIVLRARRRRKIDAYDAREAWERASVDDAVAVHDWFSNYPGTLPDDYYEAYHEMPNPQVVAFTERVLPRLQAALRVELAEEEKKSTMEASV
jgi:hypothetical protein